MDRQGFPSAFEKDTIFGREQPVQPEQVTPPSSEGDDRSDCCFLMGFFVMVDDVQCRCLRNRSLAKSVSGMIFGFKG
jgi:hypothetical protein